MLRCDNCGKLITGGWFLATAHYQLYSCNLCGAVILSSVQGQSPIDYTILYNSSKPHRYTYKYTSCLQDRDRKVGIKKITEAIKEIADWIGELPEGEAWREVTEILEKFSHPFFVTLHGNEQKVEIQKAAREHQTTIEETIAHQKMECAVVKERNLRLIQEQTERELKEVLRRNWEAVRRIERGIF